MARFTLLPMIILAGLISLVAPVQAEDQELEWHWYENVIYSRDEMLSAYLARGFEERRKYKDNLYAAKLSEAEVTERLEEYDQQAYETLDRIARLGSDDPPPKTKRVNDCSYTSQYMFMFTRRLDEPEVWDNSLLQNAYGVIIGIPVVVGIDILSLPVTAIMGFKNPDCQKKQ